MIKSKKAEKKRGRSSMHREGTRGPLRH